MSRRGGKKRNAQRQNGMMQRGMNKRHGMLWQSAELNDNLFWYYVNVITQMAMTRFRWLNLPSTCDERFLEWTLCYEGVATIAFPKKMKGTFFSTQAVTQGPINIYDVPTKWRSFGNNGWNFYCDNSNGVLVYDNVTRYPLMNGIQLYADELTHIRITKRMNRMHQQIPWIITGPQEKRQDMANLFKQVAGGEPAILGTDGLQTIDFNALQTGVPFLGEDLAADETSVWNRIYTMLGIENNPFKAERQTEDEIRAQKTPTGLVLLASLEERRRAAEKLNQRFGKYLSAPISVVLRQDNLSENWNFAHNIQTQLRLDYEWENADVTE